MSLYVSIENINVLKSNSNTFHFRGNNIIYRDIYKDLNKNNIIVLKFLCSQLKIKNYSKLNKEDLVNQLKKKIIFEI
jgi:hypothetical protein